MNLVDRSEGNGYHLGKFLLVRYQELISWFLVTPDFLYFLFFKFGWYISMFLLQKFTGYTFKYYTQVIFHLKTKNAFMYNVYKLYTLYNTCI